jgi:cyclopropane-fatty-acyl-phospholipid synthase
MFGMSPARAVAKLGRRINAPVRVVLWDGSDFAFSEAPSATLRLRHPAAAAALARPTLLSLAEAYIDGDIDFEGDINAAMRAAEAFSRSAGAGLFSRPGPTRSRHTRRGDRAAIRHHYDVSNDFYALWLDPRMVYSCAYFRSATDSLEQAQLAKLDHICRKLRLAPGDRLLDIGCGWGALAMHAAEHYGADATGITLSENQHALANERIRAAGLESRCRVLLEDYRDHRGDGSYDRIASVGMFEHVGLANLPAYFGAVQRLLREGGTFLNHGITASNSGSLAVGLGAGEFIDKHIFPQGELPHLHLVVKDMSDQDFEVHDVECLRPHYAKTLALWSAAFERRLDAAVAASSERTARTWRLYLAGCAYAFEQRWISIYQVLATKQKNPGLADLPLTRDWMYR